MANQRKIQAAATKQKLIDAAHQLLCENGYEGFSISSVTEACGVSVGTFYNYFKSKDQLQGWLQYRPYMELDDSLATDKRPVAVCIEDYIVSWIDYFSTYSPHFAASWLGRTNNDNLLLLEDYKEKYASEFDVASARVEKLHVRLNRAVSEGELSEDCPTKEIAFSIATRLYGFCVWHALSKGTIDISLEARSEAHLVGLQLESYAPPVNLEEINR